MIPTKGFTRHLVFMGAEEPSRAAAAGNRYPLGTEEGTLTGSASAWSKTLLRGRSLFQALDLIYFTRI